RWANPIGETAPRSERTPSRPARGLGVQNGCEGRRGYARAGVGPLRVHAPELLHVAVGWWRSCRSTHCRGPDTTGGCEPADHVGEVGALRLPDTATGAVVLRQRQCLANELL